MLQSQGVVAGTKIFICTATRSEQVFLSLACLKIGAVFGFGFFRNPNSVLLGQVEAAKASVVVYDHSNRADKDAPDFMTTDCAQTVIRLDKAELITEVDFTDELNNCPDENVVPSHVYQGTDPTIVLYSSGTTGAPKTLLTGTAGTYVAGMVLYDAMFECGDGSDFVGLDLAWGPAFFLGIFFPLTFGRPVVVDDRPFSWGSKQSISMFNEENITVTALPIIFLEQPGPEEQSLYPLRRLFLTGMKVAPNQIRNCMIHTDPTKLAVLFGYGSSEMTSVQLYTIATSNHEQFDYSRLYPFLNTSYRITDDNELQIFGDRPSFFVGANYDEEIYDAYWTDDNWFCTHDRAIDRGDSVVLTDRIDTMVKYKGRYVDLAELTNFVAELTQTQVNVTLYGETTTKLAVVIETDSVDKDFIKKEVVNKFGSYVNPDVFLIDTFPRSAGGKVVKTTILEYLNNQ